MSKRYIGLSLIAAVAIAGCSSTPDRSPFYQQSAASNAYANQTQTYAQPVNASYNSSETVYANRDCQRRETNRQLIGGAVGGTAGAFAGKELIGGTTGTIAGAALGGVAGYGVGNLVTNCDAPQATSSNAGYQTTPTTYQSGTTYSGGQYGVTQASFEPVSCPAGTTAHSSGTCLMNDSSASVTQTGSFTAAPATTSAASSYQTYEVQSSPTATVQQPISSDATPYTYYGVSAPDSQSARVTQSATPTQNVIGAAAPMVPNSYTGTEVTRQYGGQFGGASAHLVRSGDTVYSLSRKLCVPVSEIQGSNGLDAAYGIKIGQTLQLPASRC